MQRTYDLESKKTFEEGMFLALFIRIKSMKQKEILESCDQPDIVVCAIILPN